jgi:hypothetical protein
MTEIGEKNVGNVRGHDEDIREQPDSNEHFGNIIAHVMGIRYSVRLMVFHICKTSCATDPRRSQIAMENPQKSHSM